MSNAQQPEPQSHKSDGELSFVRIWNTIQGEGPFAGLPATFVRLAGCNLQCPACDTDYTSNRRTSPAGDLLLAIISRQTDWKRTKLVVLTGGEPMRQNIWPLVGRLQSQGRVVQIETNGAFAPPDELIDDENSPLYRTRIVCSPKTPKIAPNLEAFIDAWKYVLDADHVSETDGLPTSSLAMPRPPARPNHPELTEIYVQPLDSGNVGQNARHRDAAVASCQRFGYRLCLQLHKIVGLD